MYMNCNKLQVSVDSCPVNCIHWVEKEELQVLELLIRPQPKEGHGIFGQGWERPKNVFMAAKAFNKQQKHEGMPHQRNGNNSHRIRSSSYSYESVWILNLSRE